ncbi:MAG: hypothetical protein ABSE72_08650 [Bacteroidales bacterium]
MQKEFNKNFGISPSVEAERIAFVNRVIYFLQEFRHRTLNHLEYKGLFSTICIQFGLNPRKIIDDNSPFHNMEEIPELNEVVKEDFLNILKLLVLVRQYYQENAKRLTFLDESIEGLLKLSGTELGISYKSGMFFPKGEELLDHELIEYSLSSLSSYPNEDKDLRNALENYRAGSKYGVIENCYRCIEGLSRQILNNKGTLIDNKIDLIKSSGLSNHWKKILANYIDYGNEYGRHASENRHDFSQFEVEAYLYMTCVLVRLLLIIKNAS